MTKTIHISVLNSEGHEEFSADVSTTAGFSEMQSPMYGMRQIAKELEVFLSDANQQPTD